MAAGFLLLLLCWCCCAEKLNKRTADAEASLYTLSPCCLLRRPDFAKSFFTASAVERRFCVIFSLFLTSGFCCKRLSTGHCFGPLAVLSLSLSRDSSFSISSCIVFLLSRLLSEERALFRSASDARTVSCSFQ